MARGGKLLLVPALFALLSASDTLAQAVQRIEVPAPIERVVTANGSAYAVAGGQFLALVPCDSAVQLCLKPAASPTEPGPAPAGALPDGRVATIPSGDIRRAWYARPTGRYSHGALGDRIEAGSLVAETADGALLEAVLPEEQVFEDITPRIADLDGDGKNELIAIRSSNTGGAAVAIYGLVGGELALRGAGSENGRANRWLNIAGFLPGPDDGLTIYGVRTPHIGGRLFSLEYRDGTVIETNDIATDISNHVIGSRELGLSAVGAFDGRLELIVPSQDRKSLRFPLSERADIVLPAAIDKAIALVDGQIITATEDGVLILVAP